MALPVLANAMPPARNADRASLSPSTSLFTNGGQLAAEPRWVADGKPQPKPEDGKVGEMKRDTRIRCGKGFQCFGVIYVKRDRVRHALSSCEVC